MPGNSYARVHKSSIKDPSFQELSDAAFRLKVNADVHAVAHETRGRVSVRQLGTVARWSGVDGGKTVLRELIDELVNGGFWIPDADVEPNGDGLPVEYLIRDFEEAQFGTPLMSRQVLNIESTGVKTSRDLEDYVRSQLDRYASDKGKMPFQTFVWFLEQVPQSVRRKFTEHTPECSCLPIDDSARAGAAATCPKSTVTYGRKRATVKEAEYFETIAVLMFALDRYMTGEYSHTRARKSMRVLLDQGCDPAAIVYTIQDCVRKGKASLPYITTVVLNQHAERNTP